MNNKGEFPLLIGLTLQNSKKVLLGHTVKYRQDRHVLFIFCVFNPPLFLYLNIRSYKTTKPTHIQI